MLINLYFIYLTVISIRFDSLDATLNVLVFVDVGSLQKHIRDATRKVTNCYPSTCPQILTTPSEYFKVLEGL